MSSIAGVYLLDGSPVDPDRLKRMNDRLSHRGPDGSGLWCEGSVGLGHQMLWTTPESLHEKLPLEADGLVITADARVDNREELLPELGLREDVSDSEVILETYRKWGRNCVDRLLGDFAFVVWDKAKGELFCARDHMGVKPFYYYHEPGKIFAFATEIKALFASIVCMAREILPKDKSLKTFSAIFDLVKECDERPYIEAVLEGRDIKPYYIHGDSIGPLTYIEQTLWHMDQPSAAPNLFLNWPLNQEANRRGVRVLLEGFGGDSALSHGVAYVTELTGKGQFVQVLKEVKGLSTNYRLIPRKVLLRYSIYPYIPKSLFHIWHILHSDANNPEKKEMNLRIANTDFAQQIGLDNRMMIKRKEKCRFPRSERENHWAEINAGIHQLMLEEANITAAACSIENRFPFFDKRLIEFCLPLCGNQKIHDGWTRWIVRRALKDILPGEIYCRGGKAKLSPNFVHGLSVLHNELVMDTILGKESGLLRFVDKSQLDNSYLNFKSAKPIRNKGLDLWKIIVLRLWYQQNG